MFHNSLFLFVLKGFYLSRCGPARAVARFGHKQASSAAHLIRRCVYVPRALIPSLSTQDNGEFWVKRWLHLRMHNYCETWSGLIYPLISSLLSWDFGYHLAMLSSYGVAEVLPCNYTLLLDGDSQIHWWLCFQVSWRPVFWGLGMQFCIGLFVIRTEPGLIAFDWLGKQVQVLYVDVFYYKHSSYTYL